MADAARFHDEAFSALSSDRAEPAFVPPRLVSAASFAGKPVPARNWLVTELIPLANCTLLTGDGGTGKSLVAMQLAVAVAADAPDVDWAGIALPSQTGPVIYLSCEDDLDELHRRLSAICAAKGVGLDQLSDMHLISRVGEDSFLATKSGPAVNGTKLLAAIQADAREIAPKLIIIDTAADTFGGDENAKSEVRGFITLLRKLAVETGAAVVLLAHPSLSGMASGRGASGNVAWVNSVRSLLYLTRPTGEDGRVLDPDLRNLEQLKSNHSKVGASFRLRYKDGAFKADGEAISSLDRMAADAKADRLFLDVLAQFERQGRNVSASPGPTFAPAIMAKNPDGEGMSKAALNRAMDRLLTAGKIRIETTGPASKQRSKLVLA